MLPLSSFTCVTSYRLSPAVSFCLFFKIVCVWMCICASVCHLCVGVLEGQGRFLDSLQLDYRWVCLPVSHGFWDYKWVSMPVSHRCYNYGCVSIPVWFTHVRVYVCVFATLVPTFVCWVLHLESAPQPYAQHIVLFPRPAFLSSHHFSQQLSFRHVERTLQ